MDDSTGVVQTRFGLFPARHLLLHQCAPLPTVHQCAPLPTDPIAAPITHVAVSFATPYGVPLPPSFHADAPITVLIKVTVPTSRIPTLLSRQFGISLLLEQKVPGHSADRRVVVSMARGMDGQWKVDNRTQQGTLEGLVKLVIPRELLRDCPPSWEGTRKAKGYSVRYVVAAGLLDGPSSASVPSLWEREVRREVPVEILPFSLPSRGGGQYSRWLMVQTAARLCDMWKVHVVLQDKLFSPTSVVPVEVKIFPVTSCCTAVHMLTHLSLQRLVTSNVSTPGTNCDPSATQGHVDSQEIVSLAGWHNLSLRGSTTVQIPFRLMPHGELGWTHGMSTHGKVRSDRTVFGKSVKFTVQYILVLSVVIVPAPPRTPANFAKFLGRVFPRCTLPPFNGCTTPSAPSSATATFTGSALSCVFSNNCKWTHLPLTIGSVAEAPGARNLVWREYITDNTPDGRLRVYQDWVQTEDEGWLQSPPAYGEALLSPPYVYDRTREGR